MTAPDAAPDVRSWLASLELFGIKLGLETMRAICAGLDAPERGRPVVHLAGTNGKGSVAAFVDAVLRRTGRRVGLYTSPHLVHLEERFVLDGQPASPGVLDAALERVRSAVDRLRGSGALDVHPTYFEVTTAAAFELFRQCGTEVNVIEVGLGGRFDATNVVRPAVTAITSIALDHEQHLGSSLGSIAFEKAGIAKGGVPLVVGPVAPAAFEVIARVCRDAGAPLVAAYDGCEVRTCDEEDGASVLELTTPAGRYGPVRLGLRGEHQVDNAVVAVRVAEALDQELGIGPAAILDGLSQARWPARLDLRQLAGGRSVLVDGAHNPAGAEALARYLQRHYPGGLPVVFGAMADKNSRDMLRLIAPAAHPLVLVQAPGRRAATVDALERAARDAGIAGAQTASSIDAALEDAWSCGATIVVAGSLYLAGAVFDRLGLSWRP